MADEVKSIRILLVGGTGNGKSSTGNTILTGANDSLETLFPPGSHSGPKTMFNRELTRTVLGREVTVVDTPGVDNNRDDPFEIQREVRHAIEASKEKYDAIVLVLRVLEHGLTLNEDELKLIDMLQTILGERFWDYGIFLFTHGDKYDKLVPEEEEAIKFDEFLKMNRLTRNKFTLGKVTEKANYDAVKFENTETDMNKRTHMVENLLTIVEQKMKRNGGIRFNSLPPEKQYSVSFKAHIHKFFNDQDLKVPMTLFTILLLIGAIFPSVLKFLMMIVFIIVAIRLGMYIYRYYENLGR